ncbi:MAG: YceD family protein [Fusobacteriaceae bacterium]
MKLKIQDFGANQHVDKISLDVEAIDGVIITNPVELSLELSKFEKIGVGTIYQISGAYTTEVKVQCVRCLKEIAQDISGNFIWNFLEPREYLEYIKELKEESELDSEGIEQADNGEINISDLVRQELILNMDSYPACKPSCEDDSEIKKYTEETIDSRWAKLLEIKD